MESNSQTTVIVTLIIGFLASIAASIMAMIKDSRAQAAADRKAEKQREWDLEDRRENNAKLLMATETVAVEVKRATVIADEKREMLASVVEINAADILHHANQPMFDILIDKFTQAPDSMTDQELVQFIQRCEAIANDVRKKTPQQPAARLMLDRALTFAHGRNLTVSTRAELAENRAAGEAMRVEAEPQKGKHDKGEKEKREGEGAKEITPAGGTIEAVKVALKNPDTIEAVTVEIHADEVTVETPKKKGKLDS